MFRIIKKAENSSARTGIIETAHGVIETPAYAMVGTHGQIKCLSREKIKKTKTQLIMTNAYHLWQDWQGPKEQLDNLPAVQQFFGSEIPTMTDSGGFQIFSHGFGREHGTGKVSNFFPENLALPKREARPDKNLVKITGKGVFFEDKFLGPELSIKIQEKLAADLILAFDECTSPLHDFEYTKKAMKRTHRWAKVCLQAQTRTDQLLYGIVQGGEFKSLREESAKFVNSLSFGGIAIGGAFEKSKNGSFDVLRWTIPHLTEGRPRHFLGIGKVEDVFESVELGVDTFDCVIPTREARHGGIYTKQGRLDITKTFYKNAQSKLVIDCQCPTCQTTTKTELHQLFRSKNKKAGEDATIHNIFFFNNLMAEIREAIKNNRLAKLKKEYKKA